MEVVMLLSMIGLALSNPLVIDFQDGLSKKEIDPLSNEEIPEIIRSNVVFPAPFLPKMPTTSPS